MKFPVAFVLMFFFMLAPACAHEVTVGISSLGNEYTRDNFIISESGGIIAGIVSRGLTKGASVTGGYTTLTQDAAGNKFYVLFTRGTRESMDSRAVYLDDNTFEKFNSPSFGFELKTLRNVVIKAVYDNIDIVGSERLRAGSYNLLIRYERLSGGRPLVSISRSD